jgi:hypothetical protein
MVVNNGYTGKSGIYVEALPTEESVDKILALCKKYGIPLDYDYFHCTLMYSRYDALYQDFFYEGIISALATRLVLLGPKKECLTLEVVGSNLNQIHKHLKSLGARHSYDVYTPHITLNENYSNIILKTIHPIELQFDTVRCADVDP